MSDDTLNTCDAPFGESYTDYLQRRRPIGAASASTGAPKRRGAATPHREPQPGEYLYQTTSQCPRGKFVVITLEKTTGGPWHTAREILDHLGYHAPFDIGELDSIGGGKATLKIYAE
jgi:hypothetical protein